MSEHQSAGPHSTPPDSLSSQDLKAQLKAAKKSEKADKGWIRRHKVAVIVAALIAAIVAATLLLSGGDDRPDYAGLAKMKSSEFKSLTADEWSAIGKKPTSSSGKKVIVFAEIGQFDVATGEDSFIGNASALQPVEQYEYDSNTMFEGDPKLLKGFKAEDVVRVEGVVAGSVQYENTIGGGTDAVVIHVSRIEKVGFADLRKDVKILKRTQPDEFGDSIVEIRVTNSASTRKTYSVTIGANAAKGGKHYGEATADSGMLEPGATVKVDATGLYDVPADAKLVVDEVTRY